VASDPAAPGRIDADLVPVLPAHRLAPIAGVAAALVLPVFLFVMLARGARPPALPPGTESLPVADPGAAARAGPPLSAAPGNAHPALDRAVAAPFAFPSRLAGRPAPGLRLYVVPLGGVAEESIQLLVQSLAFITGTDQVTILPRRPLPDESWNPTTAMYDAERVLTSLRALRPHDGYRLVGVTDGDLYAADLRYLFGLASAHHDVAVLSAVRLEEEFWDRAGDWDLYRWRFLKIVAHELGHTFGLPHCTRGVPCLMSAIHGIADADAVEPSYCDQCRRRIRAALADPVASAPGALPLGL
jgi:archaemetzincin